MDVSGQLTFWQVLILRLVWVGRTRYSTKIRSLSVFVILSHVEIGDIGGYDWS